nr:putative ribonuclease H protein At1g65750 family [Tanacetum cinerariifolium]
SRSPVLNPSRVPYTGIAQSSAATLVAGRGKSHTILVIVNLVGYAKRNDFIGVRWWLGWSITSSHGNQLGGDEELAERRRIISLNILGIGEDGKKGWISSIIRKERPDILGLQETKSGIVDDRWVEELWGDRGCGFTQLPANGNSGGILLMWDTNVFLCKEAMGDERLSTLMDRLGEMREFNEFVNDTNLVETPMRGRKYTRVSDDGLKFSKLDRFLMNEDFLNRWGSLYVVALDRKLSDHCPIVLKDVDVDFGPKPFRFFDIWLEEKDVGQVVESVWNKDARSRRPDCRFRDKLKNVKEELKKWSKDKFGPVKEKIELHRKEAMGWELEAENKGLSENERSMWLEERRLWFEKEREAISMARQKARIKWDVEGDENSRFFHSYIKRRNNKKNIRGLMVNGMWCEDPILIKAEVARHYKKLFSKDGEVRPIFCNNKVEKLSDEEARLLEKEFSDLEVWDAVRGCKVVGDVQNAFIKGRYILDGVLIANETIDWIKRSKRKGIIFKVDFEKAYDCLNWRFLLDIMKRMGFGVKWCKWIESSLSSSSMSILVNGSPTEEFNLERGVRQGDMLSLFLFILAVEGLNALVNEAVEKGIFKGIAVGNDSVVVSHLQYADDTLFLGDWSKENAKTLVCILKCFEKVSGIWVNMNKSKIYGIGVSAEEINGMARWMKCGIGEVPCTYLGLPIGKNMIRCGIVGGGHYKMMGTSRSRLYRGSWRIKFCVSKTALLRLYGIVGCLERYTFIWRALKGRLPVREELDRRVVVRSSDSTQFLVPAMSWLYCSWSALLWRYAVSGCLA